MKAMVRREYGSPDVLNLEEFEKPVPGDDEVLVRVHAASLNLGDWELLTGKPFLFRILVRIFVPAPRLRTPPPKQGRGASSAASALLEPRIKVLGGDIAGRVEAVGKNVKQFRPSDEVFGDIYGNGMGAFAEYACVPEEAALVAKPAGMSFEDAAAIPQAAFIALQGVRDKGQLQPGGKVLINGAGGGAGTFAVQIAKSLGAEVTGVDSTMKLDMMLSLGADHVIDYTQEDFTRNAERYDLILDLAAYRSIFDCRRVLSPNGIYLMAGGSMAQLLQALFLGPCISMCGSKKMGVLMAETNRKDLLHMTELHEAGTVVPVIDRTFPLSETAEALRYLGEGRSKGKVVITM